MPSNRVLLLVLSDPAYAGILPPARYKTVAIPIAPLSSARWVDDFRRSYGGLEVIVLRELSHHRCSIHVLSRGEKREDE